MWINGNVILYDQVKFIQNNKEKCIQGYDYSNPLNKNAFIWRGKGILSMLESKWEIIVLNDNEIDNEWGIIWFSKTLFTPEGVDIISKSDSLSESILLNIQNEMQQYEILHPFINNLEEVNKI